MLTHATSLLPCCLVMHTACCKTSSFPYLHCFAHQHVRYCTPQHQGGLTGRCHMHGMAGLAAAGALRVQDTQQPCPRMPTTPPTLASLHSLNPSAAATPDRHGPPQGYPPSSQRASPSSEPLLPQKLREMPLAKPQGACGHGPCCTTCAHSAGMHPCCSPAGLHTATMVVRGLARCR